MGLSIEGINIASMYCDGNIKEAYIGDVKIFPVDLTKVRVGDSDYPVVNVGGKLWTAVNLHEPFCSTTDYFKYPSASGGYIDTDVFGLLYKWTALCNSDGTPTSSFANILPKGWRLPTKVDYEELLSAAGGAAAASIALRSKTGWPSAGTDIYGFNLLPAGAYMNLQYSGYGSGTALWTSTPDTLSDYAYMIASGTYDGTLGLTTYGKTAALSVRLCKDA